jgi:hypothetical protein
VIAFVWFAGTLPAQDLPSEIRDDAFWQIVSEFSEPDGPFESDNFTSNEDGYQWVIPRLREITPSGGVYVGVGPEQNFTYIAAVRPRLAFIVDIRRQNMLELLYYKAVFEMSSDRADFLSRLFSRPRPGGLDPTSSAEELFAKFKDAPQDSRLHEENSRAIIDHLVTRHNFRLSDEDVGRLRYVADAFFRYGPELHYINPGNPNARQPTYTELMTSKDSSGQNRSYLASEENFRIVQDLQRRNLIVPVVGNFAGNKALRRIGEYVKEHGAAVTVFYTSNVERYLFAQAISRTAEADSSEDWKRFYSNVAALPVNESSTFIRAITPSLLRAMGVERAASEVPPLNSQGDFFPLLDSMSGFVKAYAEGRIRTYPSLFEPR